VSNVSKGLAGERRAWHALEDAGYLVASRRHIGGACDLVAIEIPHEWVEHGNWTASPIQVPLLIEVKTSTTPFSSFPPADRNALLETAHEYGCEPLLCWTPSASTIFYIPEDEWPNAEEDR